MAEVKLADYRPLRVVYSVLSSLADRYLGAPLVGGCFLLTFALIFSLGLQRRDPTQDIPTINRWFWLEPRVFARVRWAFRSKQMMLDGMKNFRDRPWRLARGDKDVIILPTSFIPELNRLPAGVTNSRKYHSDNVISGLTGTDAVRHTDHHIKVLLGRVSPAIPDILQPTARRTAAAISRLFPQGVNEWTMVEPLGLVVQCVTEGIVYGLVGPGIQADSRLVDTLVKHTENVFSTAFVMRFVPDFLQPLLVWLLPFRWGLKNTWASLENDLAPDIQRRKKDVGSKPTNPDLMSWLICDDETAQGADPHMVTRLIASVGVGGTYSIASFVTGVLFDLTENPDVLAQVREEIREQHKKFHGNWTPDAFNTLDKLESAMKETSRLAPGSLIVYGRVVEKDHTLSNGLRLRRGDSIGVSYLTRSMDAQVFPKPDEYQGLRFYNRGVTEHRARPFRSVDGDILTWGAGRWSCPGRFIASMSAKVALVKIIDEYDFSFVNGKREPQSILHDFTFVHPSTKAMLKRRKASLGIQY